MISLYWRAIFWSRQGSWTTLRCWMSSYELQLEEETPITFPYCDPTCHRCSKARENAALSWMDGGLLSDDYLSTLEEGWRHYHRVGSTPQQQPFDVMMKGNKVWRKEKQFYTMAFFFSFLCIDCWCGLKPFFFLDGVFLFQSLILQLMHLKDKIFGAVVSVIFESFNTSFIGWNLLA